MDVLDPGQRVTDVLEKTSYDLMIIDILCSAKDGLEIYREILQVIGKQFVPVILLADHRDDEKIITGLRMGALDCLGKPVNPDELKAKVDAYLKVKRMLDDAHWAYEKTNKGIKNLYKDLEIKNQQLAELAEMKSRFTSMVSHELRTPLTAIKSGLKIVVGGKAGAVTEEQREYLELVERNIERLSRLINNVLEYQKLQAGKMEFHPAPTDINGIAKEVYRMMEPLVKERGLKLQLKLDENLPEVLADRDKISQVFINLLNNAIKFTDEGFIEIVTDQPGEGVRVSIIDSGIGIPEHDISKVFESFEQAGSGNRKAGGTGLGLAITKEIIEHHKGRIWIESEVGKGSCFRFQLPI